MCGAVAAAMAARDGSVAGRGRVERMAFNFTQRSAATVRGNVLSETNLVKCRRCNAKRDKQDYRKVVVLLFVAAPSCVPTTAAARSRANSSSANSGGAGIRSEPTAALNSTQLNSCLLLQASSARPRLGLRRYRAFVRPGICSAPSLSSASALAPPAAAANILPTSASARHQLSRASAAASASASAQLCSLCHLSHESRPVQACPARSALRQAALGSGLGVHARPRPSR